MERKGILAKVQRQSAIVRLWSDRTMHLFISNSTFEETPEGHEVRINDLAHIERFEQTETWLPRADFIAQCRSRIETPDLFVITIAAETGLLLGYTLAQANAHDSYFPYVGQRILWPARTATAYGTYVHPLVRGRGLNGALRGARNRFLLGKKGMESVVGAIHSDNRASLRSTAKGLGQPIADLRTQFRFGIATRTVTRHDAGQDFNFTIA